METHKLLRNFGSTKRPKDISRITLVVMIEGSCLVYVVCVCLSVVVSDTYCGVFLFCFSSSCVGYVASFSGLSLFD
jgi:hypothetical protein